jgi:hypothetical protein
MLIAVEFPLADCRPFLDAATHRLARPAWPHPRLDESYVRGFGAVRKRARQNAWPGEAVYCDGDRALRFADPKKLPDSVRGVSTAFSCAFRRLVSDGHTIARFETGFVPNPNCRRLFPMGGEQLPQVLKAIMQMPVKVAHSGRDVECGLADCGKPLAAHYLRATTARPRGASSATEPWWISPGSPLLILQYDSGEVNALPPYCQRVPGTEDWGIEFHHLWLQFKGKQHPVWLLGLKNEALGGSETDRLRRLWTQLLRLHAERESLQQILWAIAEKKIAVSAGTEPAEVLQQYLDESIEALSRESYAGLPQSDIQFAQQCEDLVNPEQRGELLEQLQGIRKSLFQKVARASGAPPVNGKGLETQPVDVFISYSHKDKCLCEELRTHLSMLRRQGLIRDWYDRGILAGDDWARAIDERLNTAGMILLLISANFIASDYCYEIEAKAALQRRESAQVVVVPILLRGADWKHPPLGSLEPLPKDFTPIEDRSPRSAAFTEVVSGIRELIESVRQRAAGTSGP